MNKNFKIDFIGIGAPRTGTSWIFQCLLDHPQVCSIKKKELRFFHKRENYDKGINWFFSFFKNCTEDSLKGEYSPSYLSDPQSPFLIKKHFPSAKLIVCLRNPYERAFSHYLINKSVKKIPEISFEQILKHPEYFGRYIDKGFYYKQLKKWFKIFPKEQFLILIYKDIKKDPVKFIQGIYKFLDINPSFISPNVNQIINPVRKGRLWIPFLNLNNLKQGKKSLEKHFGESVIDVIKSLKLNDLLRFAINKNIRKREKGKPIKKPEMKNKTRLYLRKLYKQDIENLEKLINKNLNYWQ